jgi:EAL and modified HD-GYP domain-containing signal transduction protein
VGTDDLRPRSPETSTAAHASAYGIARQPIFDLAQRTVGYELLFRSGFENICFPTDDDMATGCALDASLLYGIEAMCNGLPAWINCTGAMLTKGYLSLLPPRLTVAEVLESTDADREVLAACKKLKQAGYRIALDDFVPTPANERLTRLADLIKVDFRTTSPQDCSKLAQRYTPSGIKLLAEKLETAQEFELAASMGYCLFQGYFFCKPVVIARVSTSTNKLAQLELLQMLHEPVLDYAAVEGAVKQNPQLCYRLLRLVNSAALGLKVRIKSIQHALALLGEEETRKWISLVAIVTIAQGKPDELVKAALIRSKFCEMEARKLHCRETDLFLLGLLSLMDAILDMPMEEVLAKIPVAPEVGAALLGGTNKLRKVLDLVQAYDRGDWTCSNKLSQELRLDVEELPNDYLKAVQWAAAVSTSDSPKR